METVAFCEIEPFCQNVLAKHWPYVPIFSDVRKLYRFAHDCVPCSDCGEPFCELCRAHFADCDCYGSMEFEDEIGPIDIICGGFPCQDISVGHTWNEAQGLDGERSGLWAEIIRLADILGPKYVIVENVTALRTRGLARCLQDLWSVGYDAEWHIIPASAVGASHQRERIWIIAYTEGQRVEGLWPKGFKIPQSLDTELLSIRDSDGQWKTEPDICRTDDGVLRRVDRLKAVGNSVVPHIPEIIGRAIMAAEA